MTSSHKQTHFARCLCSTMLLAITCHLVGCSVVHDGNITIEGSRRFVSHTQDALALLKSRAPDAYQKTQDHIGLIRQWPQSGMAAYLDTPTFFSKESTALFSLTSHASAIAHEATHSELYHHHLARHGQPVPSEAWARVSAERTCIAYQIDVARRIGAPQSELDHLETCDGTHADVNRDGRTNWLDGLLISW